MRSALRFLIAAAVSTTAFGVPDVAFAADPPPHEVEHVRVASHDGVEMDGWIVRPKDVPAGEKLPVVLWSAPYFGQCNYYPFVMTDPANPGPQCTYETGDNPGLWDDGAVPVNFLLENGYAVAIFNVRGTGNSGGCFSWIGKDEQKDQAFLVEWLADREWSNERVGMMGLSYHGTTPWEAAIQNPPSLKTIVVAGMIGDAYTFSHTPQGATYSTIGAFNNNFVVRVSLTPPTNGTPEHATIDHVPAVADRLCPDLAKFMTEDMKGISDVRDADFWAERRLVSKFPEIETAVLLTHGFQDTWLSGHQAQEDEVWNLLPNAPKRMLEGQWGHSFPVTDDWNQQLLEWLDHWLKGRGENPPREGIVDYQDDALNWHSSPSWPPAQARNEVLYPAGDGKLATASPGTPAVGSFLSHPQAEKLNAPEHLLCPENLVFNSFVPAGSRFLSEPLDNPVLLAGNPMAHLRISSDMPGGIVAVHLFDVGPDFACAGGFASDARKLGYGAADLRFHEGNMNGRDFPVGAPTSLRIDITSMASAIERGHRLGVAISYGDWFERTGQPWLPNISVHGDGGPAATHLVLPVVQGTLGGVSPTLTYPDRPFLPDVPPPGEGDTGGGDPPPPGDGDTGGGDPPPPGDGDSDGGDNGGSTDGGGSQQGAQASGSAEQNAGTVEQQPVPVTTTQRPADSTLPAPTSRLERRPLRLRIGRTLRIDRRGRARVAARCPRAAKRLCRGTIQVIAGRKTIGRRRFAIHAGTQRVLVVRLRGARDRRAFAVRAVARDADGHLIVSRQRVKVARS